MKYVPQSIGNRSFCDRHMVKYAYISGGMYGGLSSKEFVIKMARAGFLSFLGTGGLKIEQIEENIKFIRSSIGNLNFGINLLHNHIISEKEEVIINLLLKYKIRAIEAGAFPSVTLPLLKYRLSGVYRSNSGIVRAPNKILVKASRQNVLKSFLSPPPSNLVSMLLTNGDITEEEAILSQEIPVAEDVIIEADSAGHTDSRSALAIFPSMISLCRKMCQKYGYKDKVCIGLAGGIGTPQAAAAAYIMGADFISTGSINQCTVESSANDVVKDMLCSISIEDTDYTPTGDMLETGAKIQVLKKGVLFPVRAKKLYEYYLKYDSIEEIDYDIQERMRVDYYGGKSLFEVYDEAKSHFPIETIEKAERDPKAKLALVIKEYFYKTISYAYSGKLEQKINFQIHTGVALGAFNDYVKGTELEDWHNRHVDDIALKILDGACEILNK